MKTTMTIMKNTGLLAAVAAVARWAARLDQRLTEEKTGATEKTPL